MTTTSITNLEKLEALREHMDSVLMELSDADPDVSPTAQRIIREAHEVAQSVTDYLDLHRQPEPTEAEIGADLERQGGVGFIDMTKDDEEHIRRG